MNTLLQILIDHGIEITALVGMLTLGMILIVLQINKQWQRKRKWYPPIFTGLLLGTIIFFILLPILLTIRATLPLVLILTLSFMLYLFLCCLHVIFVALCHNYYVWQAKQHRRRNDLIA